MTRSAPLFLLAILCLAVGAVAGLGAVCDWFVRECWMAVMP